MTESCGYRPLGRRRQENAVRLGAILIATNSSPYRLVNTSTMIDIEFVSGHHILTVYHVLFSGEAGEAVLRGKSWAGQSGEIMSFHIVLALRCLTIT